MSIVRDKPNTLIVVLRVRTEFENGDVFFANRVTYYESGFSELFEALEDYINNFDIKKVLGYKGKTSQNSTNTFIIIDAKLVRA